MRTISNNKPSNSKQSAPDQLKTDQEILEELKAASGGERKRSFGLTAFIVLLAIVIGVFTYMNRKDNDSENNAANSSNVTNTVAVANEANEANQVNEANTVNEPEEQADSEEPTDTEEPADTAPVESSTEAPGEEPTASSTHSETAFTETAQVGEGVTHLARRATAAFLRERGISDLKATHKVFIEDMLARQAGYGWIDVGSTQTFETGTIESAISAARALTPAQLSNLEYYATQVPGL